MDFGSTLNRVIALVITLAVILAILLLYACLPDSVGEAATVPPSKYDAEINELDRQALDDAYRAHRKLLFEVWMKDPKDGPARARVGAAHARKAYIDVRSEWDEKR